jgi:Flp pilus assembly pilin Flp
MTPQKTMTMLCRLIDDDCGQDLAEYAVALAMITLGAGVAAIGISTNMSTIWNAVLTVMTVAA